jgi:hypothetical protein
MHEFCGAVTRLEHRAHIRSCAKVAAVATLFAAALASTAASSEKFRPWGAPYAAKKTDKTGLEQYADLVVALYDEADVLLSWAPLGTKYLDFTASDVRIRCRQSHQILSGTTPCYTCGLEGKYWNAWYEFVADLEADACTLQDIRLYRASLCVDDKPCPYKFEHFFKPDIPDFSLNANKLTFKDLKDLFSRPDRLGEPTNQTQPDPQNPATVIRDTARWVTPEQGVSLEIYFGSSVSLASFDMTKTAAKLRATREAEGKRSEFRDVGGSTSSVILESCRLAGLGGCDRIGKAISQPDLGLLQKALSVAGKKTGDDSETGAAASLFIEMVLKSVNFHWASTPVAMEDQKRWHEFRSRLKHLGLVELVETKSGTRAGRMAVVELMRECWQTKWKYRDGNEAIETLENTARKGEEYRNAHPGTEVDAEVSLWVAMAYEEMWSSAKSGDDFSVDPRLPPARRQIAERARKNAIERYEALLKRRAELRPETAAAIEYTVFFLRHDIPTNLRRFACISSRC